MCLHACMSITITLADDAYERLKVLKNEKESFSEVVRRLTTRKPLTSFAGLLTKDEAETVETVIRQGRLRSRARAERILQELK